MLQPCFWNETYWINMFTNRMSAMTSWGKIWLSNSEKYVVYHLHTIINSSTSAAFCGICHYIWSPHLVMKLYDEYVSLPLKGVSLWGQQAKASGKKKTEQSERPTVQGHGAHVLGCCSPPNLVLRARVCHNKEWKNDWIIHLWAQPLWQAVCQCSTQGFCHK